MSRILELSDDEMDLLAWFADWNPSIHRAAWKERKLWPPGFRQLRDMSAEVSGNPKWREAKIRMEVGPSPSTALSSAACRLLPFQLVEGSLGGVFRLTSRGRAALKLAGRNCCDGFVSHGREYFDDVCLLPRLQDLSWDSPRTKGAKYGDLADDTVEVWHTMMEEYDEDSNHGKRTLIGAHARLSRFTSTGTYLNGSLRVHNGGLRLSVRSGGGDRVCELNLSLEGFTDLLTGDSSVPVTLMHYTGADGMRYSEPVPAPVDVQRRMLERLEATEDKAAKAVTEAMSIIESLIEDRKISKKRGDQVLAKLRFSLESADANRSFVVVQAIEELSEVAEATQTLMRERASAGSLLAPGDSLRPEIGDSVMEKLRQLGDGHDVSVGLTGETGETE